MAKTLDLIPEVGELINVAMCTAAGSSLALCARLFAVIIIGGMHKVAWRCLPIKAGMNSAKMLIQVLLTGEAFAGMTFAVWMRAVDGVLWPAVFSVDLALVTEQATRVGKPRKVLAASYEASVGSFVLVHMFTTLRLVSAKAEWDERVFMKLTSIRIYARRLEFPPCIR